MDKLKELAQQHWKMLAVAAAVLLSFLLGRLLLSPAEKTVYKDRIVEKEVVRTVTVEKEATAATKDEKVALHRHTETKKTTAPDGTTTETKVEDVGVDKVVKEVETKYVDRFVDRVEYKEKLVEKIVEVDNRRNWRLVPMVGVDVRQILTGPKPIFGAGVEHRLIGSLWVGVWGLSSGEAGVKAALEF